MLMAVKNFAQESSSVYKSVKSSKKEYKALYVINESYENKIRTIIRNINNALQDPRLKGKLKVELLAFGGGVEMYRKKNPYGSLLIDLKNKGVTMVQCENTLREKQIDQSELFEFVNYTPSGNGEMILRHDEGWAIIKP